MRGLLMQLRARGESWARPLGGGVKVSVNKQFARPDASLRHGDEVALAPVVVSSP